MILSGDEALETKTEVQFWVSLQSFLIDNIGFSLVLRKR